MTDDFYVGYLPESPAGLARVTRRRVLATLALCLGTGFVLAITQVDPGPAVFEFGNDRPFEGWIATEPVPHLVVERPGDTGDAPAVSRYLLTVFGKSGADAAVADWAGRRVRLAGQLVYRDDRTMIEVLPESIEAVEGPGPPPMTPVEAGTATFRGEIVDSKCYWGVMKPGNLKPHRGCATRCISGGVPPVLLVRDADGGARYLLLASEDGGRVNEAVLDKVAEPVEITGRLVRYDDLDVLLADPATYRRLE